MPQKITKAVIATAGNATRFLPATKNQPKQMLPIIDRPIIHYLVEEAVASGITDIILVTQAGNHIMEDYFDNRSDLEDALEKAGKTEYLEMVRSIPQMANFIYVRQKKHLPYGNGTPLISVKDLIADDEAFVYMYGDDMTVSDGLPVTKQVIDLYEKYSPSVVMAAQKFSLDEVHKYGVAKLKENSQLPNELEYLVEKPKKEDAPSQLVSLGRFVMTKAVINEALTVPVGKGNELWLPDIISSLCAKDHKVLVHEIDGIWLDTGNPISYLKTTIECILRRPDLADEFKKYLIDRFELN